MGDATDNRGLNYPTPQESQGLWLIGETRSFTVNSLRELLELLPPYDTFDVTESWQVRRNGSWPDQPGRSEIDQIWTARRTS